MFYIIIFSNKFDVGQMSTDEKSVGKMFDVQMSFSEMSVGQICVILMCINQISACKMYDWKMSVGQRYVNQMSF
jgi:hypothetical protein